MGILAGGTFPFWIRKIGRIVWSKVLNLLSPLKIHELKVKFLHQVYYTPARLYRMFLDGDSICPRCRLHPGSYLHMFWECLCIAPYWAAVFEENNLELQLTLVPSPSLALLVIQDNEQRSHHTKLFVS